MLLCNVLGLPPVVGVPHLIPSSAPSRKNEIAVHLVVKPVSSSYPLAVLLAVSLLVTNLSLSI